MNDSSSLRRERGLLALLGFVCLALVGGALYLQYAKHEDPCPLCIIQRYLFLLIALFAFLGAGRKGWGGIALFETLIAITAATGIAGAARSQRISSSFTREPLRISFVQAIDARGTRHAPSRILNGPSLACPFVFPSPRRSPRFAVEPRSPRRRR